jgi:hypothetical protein
MKGKKMTLLTRAAMAVLIVLAVLVTVGCKDEDSPFHRQAIKPEQNNPQWRYYHNYSMYEHEYRLLIQYVHENRSGVRASWSRLKEYLLSMKENMPEEKGFEFLEVYDSFDRAISDHLEKYRSGEATAGRLDSLNYKIEKDFHYTRVWPDWKP